MKKVRAEGHQVRHTLSLVKTGLFGFGIEKRITRWFLDFYFINASRLGYRELFD